MGYGPVKMYFLFPIYRAGNNLGLFEFSKSCFWLAHFNWFTHLLHIFY